MHLVMLGYILQDDGHILLLIQPLNILQITCLLYIFNDNYSMSVLVARMLQPAGIIAFLLIIIDGIDLHLPLSSNQSNRLYPIFNLRNQHKEVS